MTLTADVLIVTALALERSAIREHLRSIETKHLAPAQVDLGVFETQVGPITVALLEVGPGNIDAAVMTALTTAQLDPQVTMMVGIGGGIKDVQLGDVVASSKIYWFEPGKSTADGVKSRPTTGEVSVELVQIARQLVADGGWWERLPDSPEPRSEAVVGPIVAVERVIASSHSSDAERIARDFSDALAVAMEDLGVSTGARFGGHGLMIAIRGISDLLDGKAAADESGSQPTAAANAAGFCFALVDSAAKAGIVRPGSLHVNGTVGIGSPDDALELAIELYPTGPTERDVWIRAGGDLSSLVLIGRGKTDWRRAIKELRNGGGGASISALTFVEAMREDFPNNPGLATIPDL